MRLLISLPLLVLALSASRSHAESPDPLRLIPDAADLVLKIEKPRQLVESFLKREPVQDLLRMRATRALLDRHEARIAFDVLKYFEKELNAPWEKIVDQLAGGGAALAAKTFDGNRAVLLVLQGKDADFTKAFADKALRVLIAEIGLAEAKVEPKKATYQGVEVVSLGEQFFVANVDAALVVATRSEAMKAALDEHASGGKKSVLHSASVKQARGMLPASPLAWAWGNLEPVKKLDGAQEVFAQPRNNFLLTFFFAGWIDVVKRSPFVAAALTESEAGYDFSVHLPAGRNDRGGDVVLHVPDGNDTPASLPLLEPKGVIFSHSYYQDLGAMWTKRQQVFNADTVKDFESNEKQTSQFTLGTSFEKLLTQTGPYHRFVVVQPEKSGYAREPVVRLPAFGHVMSLRNEEIGKSVEAMLRAGGFLAYTQFGVKMFEEEVGGVPVFGYRFPEKGDFPDDQDGLRFNFAPTFAQVRNHYVFATRPELCKELVGMLQKESTPPASSLNMRMRFFAEGVLRNLNADPESVVTQSILEQGLTEKEAKREMELLIEYVKKVGRFDVTTDWQPKRFELKAIWRTKN
jgi:hypothetical protein